MTDLVVYDMDTLLEEINTVYDLTTEGSSLVEIVTNSDRCSNITEHVIAACDGDHKFLIECDLSHPVPIKGMVEMMKEEISRLMTISSDSEFLKRNLAGYLNENFLMKVKLILKFLLILNLFN